MKRKNQKVGDKLYSTDLFQNMMQTSEEVKMSLVQFIIVTLHCVRWWNYKSWTYNCKKESPMQISQGLTLLKFTNIRERLIAQ